MLPLNNNVEREEIQNLLNQIGELYTLIGNEVILYPLKIVSGIVNLTETGEQPLNYDTKDFTTNVGIITSNAPIVCYWEGAFKSKKTTTIPGLFQDKIFSAENGRKIKTWICSYSVEQVVGSAELNNNSYTTIMLNRNIRSFSRDWNPDDNEMRNYLYLYLDKKAQSPQFLRLTRKEPRFIPSNNKFVGCDLEFTNLNVEYSQSGKDIFNFVKMTNPGGNYAFPKEIETEEGVEVVLDNDKLNNRGVKDIQLEFNSPYALNSINIIGRIKDNHRIFAPRKLLLIKPHPAVASAINIEGASLNNYFACFNAKPKYHSFWGDWHSKYEASYNFQAKKTYNGGIEIDFTETEATNPVITENQYDYEFNMWLNWVFAPTNAPVDTGYVYNTSDTPFCEDNITFTSDMTLKPEDFLNHNGFINYTQETLPLEWGESTRSTFSDYGLFGKVLAGFIATFTFGYNVGWIKNNTWVPSKAVNLLIPCTTYWIGKTITTGTTLNPILFDVFDDNMSDFSATGNNSMVCGYRFELTRYFQDSTQEIAGNPEGKGGNGIWDTVYLGQTHFESGEWIFPDTHKAVLWNSNCVAYSPLNQNEEYEVDMVCYQGIGKGDCRMTFTAYPNGTDVENAINVYETRQQTNAKFKNDFHLWRNVYRLNYSEEMNNEGYVDYPSAVLPPLPTSQRIRIPDAEGDYLNNDGIHEIELEEMSFKSDGGTLPTPNRALYSYTDNRVIIDSLTGDNEKCLNVCYRNYAGSVIKTIDLTRKIGVGNLDNYESFTFNFIVNNTSAFTRSKSKRITINIADLPDNQWKHIKLIDINELSDITQTDAYPRQKFLANTAPERSGPFTPDLIPNAVLSTNYANPCSTHPTIAIKLNKTTQVLEFQLDKSRNLEDAPATILATAEIVNKTIAKNSEMVVAEIDNFWDFANLPNEIYIKFDKIQFNAPAFTSGDTNYIRPQRFYKNEFSVGNQTKIYIGNCGNASISGKTEYYYWEMYLKPINNTKVQFIIKNASNYGLADWNLNITKLNIVLQDESDWGTIRNYSGIQNNQVLMYRWIYYKGITEGSNFFAGYKIEDFYINPTT